MKLNFGHLVNNIQHTHNALQQSAVKAINKHITARNWLIGYYIVEFEQRGADRAKYGNNLKKKLSKKLSRENLSEGALKLYRQFYIEFPNIGQTLSGEFKKTKTTIAATHAQSDLAIPPDKFISKLSFSHLIELIAVKDFLHRTFYAIECIKGNWSVRELRRQINSLYFERSGLSRSPKKLSELIKKNADATTPAEIVKSVYTFEFLGLKAKDVVEESDLETALLDHLQEFILELGNGFCFEVRQKKNLIEDEYFFIDLVFYHRILKCHVLLDLKVDKFNHTYASQLNTYLNYITKDVKQKTDNPPVGILLVTDRNKTLVEYATAGMNQKMFVSKYLIKLPAKNQLKKFITDEMKKF